MKNENTIDKHEDEKLIRLKLFWSNQRYEIIF